MQWATIANRGAQSAPLCEHHEIVEYRCALQRVAHHRPVFTGTFIYMTIFWFGGIRYLSLIIFVFEFNYQSVSTNKAAGKR